MQTIKIGSNQAGQRLDKMLHKSLPRAGSGFLYKMLRKKNITLNGKKAEGKEILKPGDEVQCFFSEETFEKFSGGLEEALRDVAQYQKAYHTLRGIEILYEDKDTLIVNKPAGILSQKAAASDVSLNEWLTGWLLHSGQITAQELSVFHPSVCNRLDCNTSGIVLCGKSLAGSRAFSQMLQDRSLHKYYHTICVGEIRESRRIEGYLTKNHSTNKVIIQALSDEKKHSDYICTAYKPLAVSEGFTLLEVELITGKPHQIRAHLADIGHPVLGDFKYGDARVNRRAREQFGLKHQLLHACRVIFPSESELLPDLRGHEIRAPYPGEFKNIKEVYFHGDLEFQRSSGFYPGGHD
ncbi:MAG: RluA family pseudouridine synthase [Roseburia sp.]|nr:RluA family pseudouridine synthase [Roseburia sp.]